MVVGALYLSCTTGCLSNEYVISKTELDRLSRLPPSQRGARVQVVQELGERRDSTIEAADVVPSQSYAQDFAVYDQAPAGNQPEGGARVYFDVQLDSVLGEIGGRSHGPAGRGGGGWKPRTHVARGGSVSGPRGGGGNWNLGGGGGGGGSGDDLAVFAIILVAIAVAAATGLAVTEGIRYDGFVQLHPEQPLHLKTSAGTERTIPLAALTPTDLADAQQAVVMDDEGFGFRFDHRRALDRKGLAFKVDVGSLRLPCACASATGLASNIQFGYFPHHRFGLLGSLAIGGGTDALDQTFQRDATSLEAQYFPLDLWRIHLGGFGHGGVQMALDDVSTRTGPAFGGGAILELALTTRLALTGRVDYTLARTASDGQSWTSTTTWTAGLAIY
jgi:hypothetical protein